tara:strand:+ start:1763 stop:2128 length:366 start_codon:yes stop_codon:yes gene_type:complete
MINLHNDCETNLDPFNSIFHNHIIPIIIHYLDYPNIVKLSRTCKEMKNRLQKQLDDGEMAKRILKTWYLKSRPHKIGDIKFQDKSTMVYLNIIGTEFRQSWQEIDSSNTPITWEHIKPHNK